MLQATVLANRWIPHTPTTRQAVFLTDPRRESLYGGAAGGGKSDALLMAGLQFADVPDFAALILRRSYADLALPGAIMDRAHAWLGGTAAHWDDTEKTYTFPSGARLTFGYLAHPRDRFRYQSAQFQLIAFDELTQFTEVEYRYLFSRLRRGIGGAAVPVRMRAASNPGGVGHEWVYERFLVRGASEGRGFVPAKLGDNPHLDAADYVRSLAELDPLTRQQLLDGLWVVDPSARPFRRAWWREQHRYAADLDEPAHVVVGRWLSWDTAFKDTDTSAYTALGVVELLADYRLRLRHVWRDKLLFPELVPAMRAAIPAWNADGKLRGVVIEDKASGTSAYQTLRAAADPATRVLLIPFQPQGSKLERARQASVWCRLGCVLLPEPSAAVPWLLDFETELFAAPDGAYMDQVDIFSQAILFLEHLLGQGLHARGGEVAA
jgi:predicted phage terminase large subunit-like protein